MGKKPMVVAVVAIVLGGLAGLLTLPDDRKDGRAVRTETSTAPRPPATGGKPTRSPGVPELVSTAPRIETDPAAPGYDPIGLGLAMSPRRLFLQEPRHPTWAPAMEQRLVRELESDAARIPGIRNLAVDCRTTGCQVSWNAPNRRADFQVANVLSSLWSGAISGIAPGSYVTFFRGPRFDGMDPTDPEQLFSRLKEKRAEHLSKHRQRYEQGRPRFDGLPLTTWPEN